MAPPGDGPGPQGTSLGTRGSEPAPRTYELKRVAHDNTATATAGGGGARSGGAEAKWPRGGGRAAAMGASVRPGLAGVGKRQCGALLLHGCAAAALLGAGLGQMGTAQVMADTEVVDGKGMAAMVAFVFLTPLGLMALATFSVQRESGSRARALCRGRVMRTTKMAVLCARQTPAAARVCSRHHAPPHARAPMAWRWHVLQSLNSGQRWRVAVRG